MLLKNLQKYLIPIKPKKLSYVLIPYKNRMILNESEIY